VSAAKDGPRGTKRRAEGVAPQRRKRSANANKSASKPAAANPGRKRRRLFAKMWPWTLAAALGLSLAILGAWLLWRWGQSGEGDGAALSFERVVLNSADPTSVAQQLQADGLISDARAFTWYHRAYLSDATFESGAHWLPKGATPHELVRLLARHRSRPARKVVIPEGFDTFQIAARLAQHGICEAAEFSAAALANNEAQAELGQASFEGYLYPATYELRLNSAPREVRRRLLQEAQLRFQAAFAAACNEKATLQRELGFDEHALVTLASIVQKETAALDEAGKVAGVFLNRLRDANFKPRSSLQSDPTAGYGCKLPDAPASCNDYKGTITPQLLRDPNNRYNTYKRPGLPPGPISNPSAEVVTAVLRAPPSDALYFVLGPNGRHVFSRTFQEHRAAIEGQDSPDGAH
jgi:UPF0755 protein